MEVVERGSGDMDCEEHTCPLTVQSPSRAVPAPLTCPFLSETSLIACQTSKEVLVEALPGGISSPREPWGLSARCCGACSCVVRGGPADWEACSEAAPFVMCVHRQLATT